MKSGIKVLFGFAAGAAAGYLISKNMDTLVDAFDRVCYKLDDLQDQLADYRTRLAMKDDDEDEIGCDLDCEACEDDSECPLAEEVQELKENAEDAAEDVKDAAADALEDVKDAASDVADEVKDKFEEIKDDLSDIAGDFGGDDEIKF